MKAAWFRICWSLIEGLVLRGHAQSSRGSGVSALRGRGGRQSDMIRLMVYFRVMSIEDPFRSPGVASLCFRLLSRAQVMGFLPEGGPEEVCLDRQLVGRVGERLARAGVAQEPAVCLAD